MKHNLFELANSAGYELRSLISHRELWSSIDKEVFHLVIKKLAEDLYNKHKDEILNSMSVKSLIKATYKRLESDMYNKVKKVLEK